MKKKLALILAMMMLFAAVCGKTEEVPEEPQAEIQTEFEFDECGLAYEIPEAWVEMDNSNLIPSPTVSPNSEIYAKIRYSYAPDENMAELNNTDAHNNLAIMYLYGHGVEVTYWKAFRHFRYSAANGNPKGQVGLGNMYRHGWGTLRNSSTAFDWYRKAAAHGDADAMNNLGYMYVSGFGKLMSAETALYWYERAAAQNHPVAQYNLGALYAEGRGVERDLEKCAEWLTKSAHQGLATAQFNLGNMYYLGKGVDKDWDKAKMWYGLARNQGHRMAEQFLERLEQEQNIAELDTNFSVKLISD